MRVKKGRKDENDGCSLELKYCERCGGLWLRPVGGEQIYCTICSRAMAELPPSSTEATRPRLPVEKDWEFDAGLGSDGIGEIDLEASGGAA
jgi:hypothetical protein